MKNEYLMRPIARIYTDFPEKFGLPRQSGLVTQLRGKIIFEPPFRDPAALRGLEAYTHLWLLWLFSKNPAEERFVPTVRPPRLGGNRRMGVFATRSPNRPNPIGLSAVRLEDISFDKKLGPVIEVSGIDTVSGTPILDIKPYLGFTDSHPEAVCGFADEHRKDNLRVEFSPSAENISAELKTELCELLAQDPRPHYQNDPERIYGFTYRDLEIGFKVENGILTVLGIEKKTI